jgi:uncharacterized protein (DUF983 family)
MTAQRLWKAVKSAVYLRCPRCVDGRIFSGLFSMHTRCAVCGLVFEREPGYFIGAIYINYAVTTVLAITGYLILDSYWALSLTAQIVLWCGFVVVFPLWFFRYSRSLWLAVDHLFGADDPPLRTVRNRGV